MPVEIWILRHDEAAPAGASGDGARRLTPAGEAHAAALGRDLAARGLRAARILSSPLVRARRTAEIVSGGVEVELENRLSPGGDAEAAAADALAEGPHPVLLVGHNPDLEILVHALTGTAVPMGKGAFVRIERDGARGRVVERAG
jgi:phosphohistidine phosphatase